MPSPIGHALGGVAAGCLVTSRPGTGTLILFAAAGMLPDIDFLLPVQHRGPTHSLTAAALAFAAALIVMRLRAPQHRFGSRWNVRLAAAIGIAYASHTLLDWLGQDTWSPMGIMALWPWSTAYYVSNLDVFAAVDRRYWTAGFWSRNALAVVREVAILGPMAWLSSYRTRDRPSVQGVQPPPSA